MPMSWFPPIPAWDGLHPALVQFPVVLLLLAPLLLLLSIVRRADTRVWASASLLVAVIGTLALWLAAGTGHAAGQLVDKTPALQSAILRHEAMGVAARNAFTAITLLFALVLLLPGWLKRPLSDRVRLGALIVVLVLHVGFVGALAHTADAGGRLVHVLGVRAMIEKPVTTAEVPIADAAAVRGRAEDAARR